jgi:hypothetical protein
LRTPAHSFAFTAVTANVGPKFGGWPVPSGYIQTGARGVLQPALHGAAKFPDSSCVCQVLQNGPVTFPAECSPLDWTKFFRGS